MRLSVVLLAVVYGYFFLVLVNAVVDTRNSSCFEQRLFKKSQFFAIGC